jgi:NADH-quinone oxidoreductase subunit J
MHDFFFWLFAALTLLPALVLVFSRNTVNGAMCMILSLIGTATIYALLEAYLLAVLQVMVYAGAVVVLFLFVIMMLDVGRARVLRGGLRQLLPALLIAVPIFLCPLTVIFAGADCIPASAPMVEAPAATAANFGIILFTKYQLAFELTGLLLLAAMVGVIFISRGPSATQAETSETPQQK